MSLIWEDPKELELKPTEKEKSPHDLPPRWVRWVCIGCCLIAWGWLILLVNWLKEE